MVFLSNYQLTRQDLTLFFPFNFSVLLVFSSFPITVSSFVFLVTADVKLICIYHLTFNICWDVPQLEQLTFCCRQNQGCTVCVLSVGYSTGYPLKVRGGLDSLLDSSMFCADTV